MLTRRALALLGLLVAVAIASHACAEPAAPPAPLPPVASAQSSAPAVAATEPPAHARDVLAEIERRHGDPPAGYVGGRRFANRERRLPPGVYREYDVHPKIPGQDRGPERIVIEQGSRKAWYTGDHYRTFVPLNGTAVKPSPWMPKQRETRRGGPGEERAAPPRPD